MSYKIDNKGLSVVSKEGKKLFIEADTLITAVPPQPDTELFTALEGKVPEAYMIGDCKEPAMIVDSIADGSHIGRII